MYTQHGGRSTPPPADDLQVMHQLAELEQLSVDQLAIRWRVLIGGDAPRRNRRYLIKRLAYRIQELAYGGLTTEARTLLTETYQRHGGVLRSAGTQPAQSLIPGTALLREWRGTIYRVNVCRNGYEYDGRLYTSLTAIARDITGAKCSGPAFFRVKEGQR